jgi:hypothetical protein
MKYFTLDWWCGLQEPDGPLTDPIHAYRKHLELIRHKLPPDLLILHDSISLHDARIREIQLDITQATLEIAFDSDDRYGGLRKISRRYSDLNSFRSTSDPNIGLHGPHGYGDLG